MSEAKYERLNDYVMGVLYSPLLLIIAWNEARQARYVERNRRRGEQDDDTMEEWEQLTHQIDFEHEGWAKKCQESAPDLETDATVQEVRALKGQIEEMKKMMGGGADGEQQG